MAVRQICIWPDPVLLQKANEVKEVDASIKTMVSDMFETMYKYNGIGLAANQIGVTKRVIIIDLDPKNQSQDDDEVHQELESWNFTGPVALINPEIIKSEGEIIWEEGCLSVPGISEEVKRNEHVWVSAIDVNGNPLEIEAHGLFAVALQHETDHLNGRVFVDYLSKLKRDVIRRKMKRLSEKESTNVSSKAMI
ncbi:MAG: peptide deformylase [Deltaproteobacteria bacterium]|nr:peptide deformylase [Deltaproteobacteria bacterium]